MAKTITIPDDQVDDVYGILLRARASELAEKNRLNRIAAAYHDRQWTRIDDTHGRRIEVITSLINQLRD